MNGSVITNGHTDKVEETQPAGTIYDANSVATIRAALAELHKKEASVTSQLDALISSQRELQRELGRLDLFRTNLGTSAAKARSISNTILADASTTASRISNSVKKLDLEQSRVKSVLTVVEQVRELKACVLGVSGSMGAAQDWETAASYLNRASKLSTEVIDGIFAQRIVPTAEVPDSPRVTLENASESLCGFFLQEFDKAVKASDGTKITRFFKLFPLINRSEVGLDVYGRYVCQGVAARARANLNAGTNGTQGRDGFFYANALTKLFEHIAQIIDGHGGLVERHYGAGKMSKVIERLQIEADLQGGIIIDTWCDERRVDRVLTDTKSYAYTFLVQSFLPAPKGSSATPRTGSPAPRVSDDEGFDMREVDALLNEMTNMLGKWALYTRFVTEKCAAADGSSTPVMPAFLLNSTLMKKVDDRLLMPFNMMTTFFFRRSVEKAFQLDEQPSDLSLNPYKAFSSNPPHVTSAIEDIIYITNKVLQQSLATSQTSVITSVVPTLSRVMGSDFLGMEQRKMRDQHYPKAVMQGSLPPENTIVSFLVLINNLDIAKDYIDQMIRNRLSDTSTTSNGSITALYPYAEDAALVVSTLKSFSATFYDKTTELLTDGIHVIFNNVIKPRIRPILSDAFRDVDYVSTTEQLLQQAHERGEDDVHYYNNASSLSESMSDTVRQRFQHGWDALTKPIGRIMTDSTFTQLLGITIVHLSRLLEKRLWTYAGHVSPAGASRLEHDVNSIAKVVVHGQKYSFRDSFLRCTQICMIMSMDQEEWDEVLADSEATGGSADGVADKLTAEERTKARAMVVQS